MKGLVFIATFLLGLGVGTTVAWVILKRMVAEVRAQASHAMECLVEQQTENATLRNQAVTAGFDASRARGDTVRALDLANAANLELKEALKELRALKHQKQSPRVRVDIEDPVEPTTRCRARAPARKRAR